MGGSNVNATFVSVGGLASVEDVDGCKPSLVLFFGHCLVSRK